MANDKPAEPASAAPTTPVHFEHSTGLGPLLSRLGVSLAISTYQAGKLITVGTFEQKLDLRFHQFEQAMGIARTPRGIAVGTKRQIWFLQGSAEVAPKIAPAGHYDVALLASHAHFTGPVMGHEMAQGDGELWFLNTLFSCVCTLKTDFHFVPRWRPPFVTALAAEDRCHLNGLAMENGRPRFVTVLGETDTPGGWRANKAAGGCLIDVSTGQVIVRGLSMPHSPRIHRGQILFLNSGYGQINRVDRASAATATVAELPGYTRGLDVHGQYAFVGLSRIRETSVFGGLPIAGRRTELRCGLAVVDLETGTTVATLLFHSGVEEIFEVKVLPGFRNPIISGPLPDTDGTETIWMVPRST
jgi:uncharacterized protein (TIGR03032 family)